MSLALIQALSSSQYNQAFYLLISGQYDISATDENGLTAMHIAASKGYAPLLKLMYKFGFNKNARADNRMCPLHYAVLNQHLNATIELIEMKATVNVHDINKTSPLHQAVIHNSSNAIAITRALIAAKANLNYQDSTGKSPLHIAVRSNAYSQARLLLQAKANTNRVDTENKKPIDYATQEDKIRIKTLLAKEYEDSQASDTDSEDVDDYEFSNHDLNLSTKHSSSPIERQDTMLSGNLNGNVISFEEEWIAPNNDCGFIGLGTDRNTLTDTLRANNTIEIREMMWQEIAEVALADTYKPDGIEDILNNLYSNPENPENYESLKIFCQSIPVFNGYLDLLNAPGSTLWLGYQSAKAYAILENIQLYIWEKNDDDNTLTLTAQIEANEPQQEIHLLHTDSYTHFNLLIKKDTPDNVLDELTQKLNSISLNTSSSSSKASKSKLDSTISHSRGVHFYKEYYTRKQRKQSIDVHRKQDAGLLPKTGIYSSATYEVAKCSLELPKKITDKTLKTLEIKLNSANKTVTKSMQILQKTGEVTPCLGRGSPSRGQYSSRYIEFVQRYVNSYHTLMDDMKNAPSKKIDGRTGKTGTIKWNTFKKLGFTKLPLVSTSESIYWGLEYATALLNWDKSETHQPREGQVTVLAPCYNSDGHPRFPYLGILYVTLHSPSKLADGLSTRILDLFANNDIDTKCSSPGGHLKGGYVKARERVFIGGIEKEYVKLSLVIRVPSFYHEYRPFIEKKYGIDESTYNNFKNKLKNYGHLNQKTGKIRNLHEFHNTEQKIIQHVISAQENLINERIKSIAEQENMSYKFLGIDQSNVQDAMPELSVFIEKKSTAKRSKK